MNVENKNHWIFIGYEAVSSLKEWLFLLIILFFKVKWYYIVLACVIILIYSIIKWYNIKFYISDEMLVYKQGILSRKKQEIPLDKISTVDMEQNLINRIFDVCNLKVDSGAVGDGQTEVKITVKMDFAKKFREELLKSYKSSEEIKEDKSLKESYIKASMKDLAIYGITKNKLGWLVGLFAILSQINEFLSEEFLNSIDNKAESFVNGIGDIAKNSTSIAFIVISVILVILFLYIIVSVVSILIEIIKYYNFSLYESSNKLNIEYGLITKKKYSLPIEKIQALKLKQNFLGQFLGLYNMEGIVIGYGDEDDKKAIIFPVANEKLKNHIINTLLPEFNFEGDFNNPPKRAIFKFIVKRNIISLILISPAVYFIPTMPLKLILISICILSQTLLGYRNYKNTSMGLNRDVIVMSSGAVVKTTHLIKQKTVQSIGTKQNPLQRFRNVCNYKVDVCTNYFGEVVEVKHLECELIKEMEENLIV